jgi:serine/threonine protein kinase
MSTQGSRPIVAVDKKGRERRYQTDTLLGSGASGEVHLARKLPGAEQALADETRRVAIKLTYTMKWKGYLATEARLLHALQEKADEIVKATGGTLYRPVRILSGPEPLSVDDGRGALLELEYLDGVTLRQWCDRYWAERDQKTPNEIVDDVLAIARQLAEALLQIQSGPDGTVIHRDIKPENLMQTSRGLRLFDFNVAREDDETTKTRFVGTEGYIAPEVVGAGYYDARADLFSAGVILWEIAHGRRFDGGQMLTRNGRLELRWPTALFERWPDEERDALGSLLIQLVCNVNSRLDSPRRLLALVEELEAPRRAQRQPLDPLADLDMIGLLSELRPSGLASVVTDTSGRVPEQKLQDFLRARMQVEDPLEGWLLHEVEQAATSDTKGPALFLLAGNAGDGKSHLLYRLLRVRLAQKPHLLKRIRAIADATHALTPDASQMDRLEEFFAPFADENPAVDDRVHLIAMNTGMVIRFFESPHGQRFRGLYQQLEQKLGLRSASAAWKGRIEVVNLDLRDLIARGAQDRPSFAERMLDRLDPEQSESIPGPKWAACKSCLAFALCPVAFNMRALREPMPRKALLRVLRRAALDTDVHLSPRNLWGFLYRLVTGGVERYDQEDRASTDGQCDVVRAKVNQGDGAWLLEGQFTELLFKQPGASVPWSALARHDPAFSSAPAIDRLHTRLSIKTELDNAPETVAALGGVGPSLAGLALDALGAMLPGDARFKGRRRDAAVRRHVLFHPATFDAWVQNDGGVDFEAVLSAYDEFSRQDGTQILSKDTREKLKQLRQLVQDVFLYGNGRLVDGVPYLRVSQPNVRAESELLVRADRAVLDEHFHVQKIVREDVHIAAHRGRAQLLSLLGYQPTQVTLDILGIRLTVDLALYEFLRRVNEGQKPSMRALSQFQALLFIGERVGNELARAQRTKELFVLDKAQSTLYRLADDDFGQPHLKPARPGGA